ncbi:transmembrane protein 179-like [Anneissia japonica]|uniref:transmembrane protein 179-like n=1 Tax=Anneissia japonica TaxID=1529436 RepID=UPI0014258E9B|nr:transmembrane protein 179-like [Anneissia japonica]
MGFGNLLALSQVCGFVLLLLLSLFIVPPMCTYSQAFEGKCLLFASGHYDDNVLNTSISFNIDSWGAPGFCTYTIFMGVAQIIMSFVQIVRLSIHLANDTDSSFIGVFMTTLSTLLFSFMMLICCLVVTIGFMAWCRSVTTHSFVSSCEMVGYSNIWSHVDNIDATKFSIQFGITQFGLWFSLIVWFVEMIFVSVKLFRYHQQEDIMRSLMRERQRLLGQYQQPEFM